MLSVALFVHRKLEDVTKVEDILTRVVEGLPAKYAYVDFYVGRNSEFDEIAASLIKRLCKRYGSERCGLILVLPYPVKDTVYYETYYDSIFIPHELSRVHCKNAITVRNR